MRFTTLLGLLPLQIGLLSVQTFALTVPTRLEGRDLSSLTKSQIQIDPRGGSKVTVVAFLSSRCPCSASHEPTLKALAKEFSKEARFVGIHSNADESEPESNEHFKKAGLAFPVIQDNESRIANALGAVKTPHVFVLSARGEILFQGGVDDSHDAARATKPYLKNALEALRAGRTPEVTLARSLGCQIRR